MLLEESYDSVKTISIDLEKLRSNLRAAARTIMAERPEVSEIRVFGSIARGDYTGTSDVDVLVILRDTPEKDNLALIRKFYSYFDLPVGVDLIVLTEGQIKTRLEDKDPFVTQILEESYPL